MTSSQFGAGYELVRVPPVPSWSAEPGGALRHGNSNTAMAASGNHVWRAPWLVVREAEAGANYPGGLHNKMFLPDGRLVPALPFSRDMFHGAGPTTAVGCGSSGGGLRMLVPAIAMFAGASVGYKSASKHQAWGAIGGAVVGGILGAIFR
jgi:hypothetical protein